MQCLQAEEKLARLCDRELLTTGREYASLARHWLTCQRCRARAREFRRLTRNSRQLPQIALPAGLHGKVAAALPCELYPVIGVPRSRRLALPVRGMFSAGVLLCLLVGLLVLPRAKRSMAAEVADAVSRVNTWHLTGWKLEHGKRVPWEIWGCRKPFFYRNESGGALLLDDGRQRIREIPMANGGPLAFRMPSDPTLNDNQWAAFVLASNWRTVTPWRQTPDAVYFRTDDSGMDGPYSIAHDIYAVDPETWLPRDWEYRHEPNREDKTTKSWLSAALHAEYNVRIPPEVTTWHPAPETQFLDTTAETPGLPSLNVEESGGLAVQLLPLTADPDGVVLVAASCWLGGKQIHGHFLEPPDAGSPVHDHIYFRLETPTWANTIDGTVHPYTLSDDRGRDYVLVSGTNDYCMLPNGDPLLVFAPLEPLAAGAPPPLALSLKLSVIAQIANFEDWKTSSAQLLPETEFHWTLPLPPDRAPFQLSEYLPAGEIHRETPIDSPEELLAEQRAREYSLHSQRYDLTPDRHRVLNREWLHPQIDRCFFWYERAISLCEEEAVRHDGEAAPKAGRRSDFTAWSFRNQAQFLRLPLATELHQSGDRARAEAVLRDVLSVKERHPETWGYYAESARKTLQRWEGARHK